MVYEIEKLHSEYAKVLDAYTGLLTIRSFNLLVKAHPVALIPVTVEAYGAECNLEDVADVAIPDDDHFELYPKNEEFLKDIGKAVFDVHPELKMEVASQVQRVDNDSIEQHYLRLEVPYVDKNRRDILLQGVDLCHEDVKAQYEETRLKYTAKLAETLLAMPDVDGDAAKKRFAETLKNHQEIARQTIEDKKQEIEEAYKRYCNKRASSAAATDEEDAALGNDAKSSYQMSEFEEEEETTTSFQMSEFEDDY